MTEEATIRRGARNARYTTLPNQVLEDVRLSMEARWLLSYLLSKPDNWIVRVADISKKGGCGRDKARRMVNELVEFGYAEKEQNRGEEGKFGRLSLVVYDEPREAGDSNANSNGEDERPSVAFLPQTENPSTAEPSTVNAALVKTDVIKNPDSNLERETRESADGQEGEPGEGGAARQDDPRKFEARVKRLAEGWPGWANSSTAWAVKQFAALTDAERAEAERCRAGYLAHCGGKALSVGTYLAERKWRDLPDDVRNPPPPSALEAKPFGPLWGASRMRELLNVAPRPSPPPASAFMAERLARDDEVGRAERLRRQIVYGWPTVVERDRLAESRKGFTVPSGDGWLSALMEPVPVGSAMWAAWEEEHARRGWPWVPDPGGQRVVFFPKGGPAGLEAFERAVRAGEGVEAGMAGEARKAG